MPTWNLSANSYARAGCTSPLDIGDKLRRADYVAYPPANDTISHIVCSQQSRGGNDDGAELHGRQHGLPKRGNVSQHQQNSVSASDAQLTKVISASRRAA